MMAKSKKTHFEKDSVVDVLHKLDIDPSEGLNNNEAASRKEKYGLNEIESKERSPILALLSHYWGPIPWMIEIAVILSAVAGR